MSQPQDDATEVTAEPELELEPAADERTGPRRSPSAGCVGGRYQILALLGVGGMGRVYRARDLELDEVVALKVLYLPMESAIERFRLEVKLARRVTHRNVARTFDLGEHEGTRFLTMELIDGPSLAEIVASSGPQRAERVTAWARDICAGLAAAHAAGVIHRDLKPQNVLVERGTERVVLTDFGIARAIDGALAEGPTVVGQVVGTPAYMAPEQLAGRADLDGRVDVWALGATMYRLLTGASVRSASSGATGAPSTPAGYAMDPRALRSEVPESLARIVVRCLEPDRDARFASADAVAAALGRTGASEDGATSVARPMKAQARTPSSHTGDEARRETRTCTVAVLPFENGGDACDAHFAEGLADEITDALSMMPRLRVSALGAVRAKQPALRDPREVGRELDVDVVVTGSVRRNGDHVRVAVRLVGVADGFQIWAQRIEGELGDLLRIGARAADALAAALATRGATGAAAAMAARTDDARAIELFFQGRQEYRRFWAADVARATELFEAALERAPDDPVILAAYAMACARRGYHGGGDAGRLARRAAERALAAAPHLGEAHLATAHVLAAEGRPHEAAAELVRAVELSPLLVDARESLGVLLVESGATRLGCDMLQTALALDPEHHYPHVVLARTHALLGRWEDAHAAFGRATSAAIARLLWLMQTRIALWQGERSKAAELRQRAPPAQDAMLVGYGYLALLDGEWLPPETVGFLDRVVSEGKQGDGRRTVLVHQLRAEASAFVGDAPTAIEHIERASHDGLFDALWMERCPLLAEVRDVPQLARARGEVLGRARRVIDEAQGR